MIKPAAALLSLIVSLPVLAEELALPIVAPPAVAPIALPAKGSSMQAVSRQFGQPRQRHPAAGGDTPKHPPITRWDYDGFSVFFENQHVVHAVRPDAPAPIARRDGLVEAP